MPARTSSTSTAASDGAGKSNQCSHHEHAPSRQPVQSSHSTRVACGCRSASGTWQARLRPHPCLHAHLGRDRDSSHRRVPAGRCMDCNIGPYSSIRSAKSCSSNLVIVISGRRPSSFCRCRTAWRVPASTAAGRAGHGSEHACLILRPERSQSHHLDHAAVGDGRCERPAPGCRKYSTPDILMLRISDGGCSYGSDD